MLKPLRIGILGAARINRSALIQPARENPGIEIVTVAARDRERAVAYARRHRIPAVHGSYTDLLDDPAVDAVYIPLPATLHGRWTVAALRAGKHVLCEKPFTANALEAGQVARVASASGLVTMEAYHTAHHPGTARLRDIVESGALGTVETATARFCVPIPPGRDIRWNPALGGGGLLDVGYYPVRLLRDLFGSEPAIERAEARRRGEVDRSFAARLRFPSGVVASVVSSLWSARVFRADLEIRGRRGTLRMFMPYHPQHGTLRISGVGTHRRERPVRRSSYGFQLEAFRKAVQEGGPTTTGPEAAVRHLQVIDDLYRAAEMAPRQGAEEIGADGRLRSEVDPSR